MTDPTSSTSSTASATSSILTTLNAGSGLNTASLVSSLVDAQFAYKNDQLSAKGETISKQISDAGTLLSGINAFASSLSTLVKGGSLATQPTSSNTDVVTVTGLSGAKLSGLSAQIEVRQLAAAQAAASTPVADHAAAIGTGSFTLTFGAATVDGGAITGFTAGGGTPVQIAIDANHASLDGIAQAINAAKTGVTATIITDSDGARLLLRGQTGASQAFTLTASDDSDPGLAALNVGVGASGTTIGTSAQDAIVAIDGLAVKRSSNSINELIPGVKLNLASAKPGTIVTLGSTTPTAALSETVNNFVETFNQLQAILKPDLDAASGSLRSDSATKALARSLSQLTVAKLANSATPGAPTTLAELGVETNRDGTLSVDATKLSAALANYPEAVEAIFADGTAASGDGISAALNSVAKAAADTTYGLGASTTRYTKAQSDLADQLSTIQDQRDTLSKQLTQQFASMDARVAAYKSTQTFLDQQIDAWNAAKN